MASWGLFWKQLLAKLLKKKAWQLGKHPVPRARMI